MGAAPSRETHSRGLFTVDQGSSGSSPFSKKQDIVLIPLTKEFFPSPDCPLFVQFHKARCDAAVNYYFRQPGNPGDLSRIPSYAHSYRLPGEEEQYGADARRLRRTRKQHRAHTDCPPLDGAVQEAQPDDAGSPSFPQPCSEDDDDSDEAASVDESYLSREALYRGVVERVEDNLFDTDAEMREAYRWAQSHPHTTMGPNGKKQRKVLPVLCAVAFRYDPSRVQSHLSGGSTEAGGGASGLPQPVLAAIENAVYLYGSIINVVGCFGFVSMQEEVDAANQQHGLQGGSLSASGQPHLSSLGVISQGESLLLPGSGGPSLFSGMGCLPHPRPPAPGTYRHQPYSFGEGSQASDGVTSRSQFSSMGTAGGVRQTHDGQPPLLLPPPVAAPLAAMVFLTKSAGEQNLGRVTFMAASTYYFQMLQAGVIQRCEAAPWSGGSAPTTPAFPSLGSSSCSPPMDPRSSNVGGASSPPPGFSLPPLETFSFSSLLTNIPILSFLYEMKYRWGYLGALGTGTATSENNRFNKMPSMDSVSGGSAPTASVTSGHRTQPARVRRSAGGLSTVDFSSGQNVTDEMEMWITDDNMLHGRISKDLAERLCWSLAERPQVMQERVSHLPSEEDGYWRYRGLVDRAHPPPLPTVGRKVAIHPLDVYVMGRDVLPGFDEGDILRFDADRNVWCADHSIPLEGVVLAAMRPFCKQAREASPDDPHWVTRHVAADIAESMREDGVQVPSLPTTPTGDGTLRRVHERVGNFFVYRFERDGKTYYHGTVPNFANPKKNRQSQHGHPHLVVSPTTATSPVATANKSGHNKTSVHVPRSISRALFSLLPPPPDTGNGPVLASNGEPWLSGGSPSGNTGPTTYLAGRVTSTTVETAKRWVTNLYSYAYTMGRNYSGQLSRSAAPTSVPPSDGAGPLPGGPYSPLSGRTTPMSTHRRTSTMVSLHQDSDTESGSLSNSLSMSQQGVGGGTGSYRYPCTSPHAAPSGRMVTKVIDHHRSLSQTGPQYPPAAVPSRLPRSNSASYVEAGYGEQGSGVQNPPPVKRYMEGGCYIWDWRSQQQVESEIQHT